MATLQQYEQARLNKRRVAARGKLREWCRKDLSEALGVVLVTRAELKHGPLGKLIRRRGPARTSLHQSAPVCTSLHQSAPVCTSTHRARPHPSDPAWTIVPVEEA